MVRPAPSPRYQVDEADPRAPSQSLWDSLEPAERAAIVAALPSDFPLDEAAPPEGDAHQDATEAIRRSLKRFFERRGRRVYVGSDKAVYYPGERVFSPDVLAVVDVEPHPRESWIVSAEERGIDFALEVVVSGRRRKDVVENVERYARLGIPEYFVFEPLRGRLIGHRLRRLPPAATSRLHRPGGRYVSTVLGLDLSVEGGRVRFWDATAPILADDELIEKLERAYDEALRAREEEARAREEEARAREEEARAREEEARAREETEKKLAEALAELERLRRER